MKALLISLAVMATAGVFVLGLVFFTRGSWLPKLQYRVLDASRRRRESLLPKNPWEDGYKREWQND